MEEKGSAEPLPEDARTAPLHEGPVVVGIGASAGGLSALKLFFSLVPEDCGLTFVVVVHLSPEHVSRLSEILQPYVNMPVTQVTDTTALKPNHVYVIPPGRNISAIDTHLRLSDMEEARGERAPIDHFFFTLADVHDGHSVGVILSGTGSDGALGLRHIKEQGGLTVVQEPSEAEYDGMPRSAIGAGPVDLILPLAEIPEAILDFVRTDPRLPKAVDDDDHLAGDDERTLQLIFGELRGRTGHDFSGYKRATVMRRIRRRMQLLGLEHFHAYLDALRGDLAQSHALMDDLLIVVTSFFRDPEVFEHLRQHVLPGLFQNRDSQDRIRVWVVGCATGEEAYSLAMLLLEEASRHPQPPKIQVFASDPHAGSLALARQGAYPETIEATVSPERLERFFVRQQGGYRVRKEVRETVVFASHNLLHDPPFTHIDLISCRNLLIYLQRPLQHQIFRVFHYALNLAGHLVLGSAESLDQSDLFQLESKPHCLYRRRSVPSSATRLAFEPSVQTRVRVPQPPTDPAPPSFATLHERLAARTSPPSILVNDAYGVVHISAQAGRFLQQPTGTPTNDVFSLVREELRLELRAGLYRVKDGGAWRSAPVALQLEGELRGVILHVHAAPPDETRGFYLVTFEPLDRGITPAARSPVDPGASDLEAELDASRQRLESVVGEYEQSRETMRASNEELQSMNEELRSTMEELETSKEELQSINEELQSVNQENRHRVDELSQLSADLQNLLRATEIATLFLDRNLRILRYTPRVAELFNIRESDRGRPLTDLTNRLGSSDLLDSAREVLTTLIPIESDVVRDDDRHYLARIMPYRTSEDRIDGVVLTLFDVTDLKRTERSLRELTETLELRVLERTVELRQTQERIVVIEHLERRRIAHILHDDLQQLLYGIQLKLSTLERAGERGDVERMLPIVTEARGWIEQAIDTTRRLTVDLSPPAVHGETLQAALMWLATQMRELHGLEVAVERDDHVMPLEDARGHLLFQIARELLFNVVKHAETDRARIRIERVDGSIALEVRDWGAGFDVGDTRERKFGSGTDAGFGLSSVHNRVRLFGGVSHIESSPGSGTCVEVSIPAAPVREPAQS